MRNWLAVCLLIWIPLWPAASAAGPSDERIGPRLRLELARPQTRSSKRIRLMSIYSRPPEPARPACLDRICAETRTASELAALLGDPTLQRVELPGRYRLRLDRAGEAIGAVAARARYQAAGAGVLIAVIDTGLDWSHPDFLDPAGRPRVAWLLDQSLAPAGLHPELEEVGGGAVYSREDLAQGLIDAPDGSAAWGRDAIGHGTHVAGIAASNDPVYTGVAPEAQLVAIKALSADGASFPEDQLLRALAFAKRVAEAEGRPLVVNLSLGSQLGAHDGSEPIELAIDALSASAFPPCTVVVAAGNEAGLGQHARAAVRAGGPPLRFEVLVPEHGGAMGGPDPNLHIDLWSDGPEPLTVQVQGPSGDSTEPLSASPWSAESWSADGWIAIATAAHPVHEDGPRRILIQLHGEAGLPLAPGRWIISLSGSSPRVDGWIGDHDLPLAPSPRFLNHLDDSDLVGPPATARGAIAVGAFVSRTDWTDADERLHQRDLPLGGLAAFSVRGPTRDGRLKPELVAPGQFVASTLSAAADPRSPQSMFYTGGYQSLVMPDGRHAIASGTSMASPFVAGALACALGQDAAHGSARLQELLAPTATADGQTGTTLFDGRWGFGKLSLINMLDGLAGRLGGQFDADQSLCGAARTWLPARADQTLTVTAVPRDKAGRPLGPGLPLIIGGPGIDYENPTADLGDGRYTRTLSGAGRRGERLRPVCRLYGRPFAASPTVTLAASEQEASQGGVEGGGPACGPGPGDGSPSPIWLLAVLLLLISGRSSQSNSRSCSRSSRWIHRWK